MSTSPSGAIRPPLLLAIWATSSVGLGRLWPLVSVPESMAALGRPAILAGVALVCWAMIEMHRHRTSPDHGRATASLVTSGPFRFSRNPIYLGLALITAGVSLHYDNLWSLLLVIPLLVALQKLTIAPEERYLETEFGGQYRSYKDSVRQWL